jgi:glycosyltransferase involved in cell wall biosynthesis
LGPAKGRVILNGRPDAWFAEVDEGARQRIRAALEVPDDSLLVLTTASLELRKGHQYQLQALGLLAARCPDLPIHLMWAGGGTQKQPLRARAAKIPFPVHLLGERGDIPDLLDACDGVVLTSEFEGMPLAVMEAMARGKPVAATAVSGIPEALGPTGWLLPDPRQDAEATAAALADVLVGWQADPVGRQAAGAAGRERAQRLFREARMVAEYVGLLRSMG